jgi:hypothetical protein
MMLQRITINLFAQQSMHDELKKRLMAIRHDARDVPDERLLAEDLEALAAQIADKHAFVVPTLHFDQHRWDEPTFKRDSPEATLTVHIPITGDPSLLACYHNSHSMQPHPVEIANAALIYTFSVQKAYVHEAPTYLASFKTYVDGCLPPIHYFANAVKDQLLDAARHPLRQRHSELQGDKNALEQFKRLGFPIRKRTDEVAQVYVPIQRKVIVVPDSPKQLDENPRITMDAYEQILTTITAMAHGVERSPSAFQQMTEEDFRMVLLIGLNAVYEGKATGETFNNGKTDILIRVGDNNIFIAECFVWDGIKTAESKLDDQLMTYAMWRDTKTALIVFNRTKNLTAVVRKLRSALKAHAQCVQELPYASETGSRYVFRRKDDPDRQFYLTCLAFDVPSP